MLKPYLKEGVPEAGCDEAGRGCLAGPVVAAAVILPADFGHEVLTDSKQLTKAQRNLLKNEIMARATAWAVGWCSAEEIDRFNILQASFIAMHRAIEKLSVEPRHLLIDGNRFKQYHHVPHTCVIKGDSLYFNIAAASVLAKTYRDEWMEKLGQEYPAYQWAKNKGYPTVAHRLAIRAQGPSPYHRKSFRLLPEQQELFK